MQKSIFLIIHLIIFFFSFSLLLSDTIIVDIDGGGYYLTIQEGINAAIDGDTVLVYTGIYYENINYNGKNITVASLYLTTQNDSYIDSTIIDGNQNGSVVTFNNGEDSTAILCGFTIQNGSGTYYSHNYHGGGILCISSNPTINNCIIGNNSAEQGGGISCVTSNIHLTGVTIKNNNAEYGGGGILFWNNSNASFDVEERCNIFLNYGSNSCDLRSVNCDIINIVVDTFTVAEPDNYFAYPVDYFTFDILNYKIEPVNQDLYVSPDGDNTNSGLTQSDPLKNIAYALTKIASDSTHPNTIHLVNGIYSPSLTEEIFPLNCRSYVSIIGESEENTILDGDDLSGLIACVFEDNFFYIENLTIQNGSSSVGSGIHFNTNSSPIIKNVTIKDTDPTSSMAVHCRNSNPVFDNVTIKDNSIEFTPLRFYNCNPMLINCIIQNNSTSTYAGASGGITSTSSDPIILNCLLTDNEANDWIWGYGGGLWAGNAEIINATVCDNYANTDGGGIYSAMNNVITNSIFYNNTNNQICVPNNAELTISYSDIQDGEPGIGGSGTVHWQEGNIDSIPQFVGGNPVSYQLTEGSPCIDAGNPDTTGLNLPPYDLAGNPRIVGDTIDMGAYEWQDTSQVVDEEHEFYKDLYLFQNKPNPFSSSTTITFISADYERIKDYKLSIYNVKGQLIKTYDGKRDNFWVKTDIVWNGTDEDGNKVSPGVYFYKLSYGKNSVARKMILIRE